MFLSFNDLFLVLFRKFHERAHLLKRERPHRLRITLPLYAPEPSPCCTPCSVFSFDLPSSPVIITGRPRITRPSSHCSTSTPRNVFSFDTAFDSLSPKTPCTPKTPISPRTPRTPRVSELPTIEESRNSFSFDVSSPKDEIISTDESVTAIDNVTSQTTEWKSIRMMMIIVLITRIQFTVYFASLWPFLQEVDGSATIHDFAVINAIYSIGIAGSAPFFGYWSNKVKDSRQSGNSLLPTYWTYAAAPDDRSTAAALFDGAFCLGIALGPGFQLIFSPLSYPGVVINQYLQINMYTMPAIVANVLVGITLIMMGFFFDEVPMFCKHSRKSVDSTGTHLSITLPPFDKVAVFCCIFAKMVQMFIYANMETIGSMYTQQMFDLSRTETTQFNSVLVSLSGFLGFIFLLTYVWSKIGKRVDNRVGVIIGIMICIGFLFSTYSWWFYTGNIESDVCHSSWCSTTPRIPWCLYACSYVIVFGIGFAMMNVHLASMYSGVLGPRRQGTMHGINTLLASCSRILGPVIVTDMFGVFGPRVVWLFQFSTWMILLTALAVFHKRLVPLQIQEIRDDVKIEDESIKSVTQQCEQNE
ncbi:hypothetical protein DICVIV_00916 [Dictyocaulus viviparus]|uniref:Transporter, major facilitator family protein n=1 Tax=Dictyocaulus viviparus TaxID=29172 RepID=A0A0D8YE27_DICVI|nr:hypothetical protein DICVIV_00916 [Dictyocaulus viviparus]